MQVSRLGMGCWAFGGGAYWGAQNQRDVEEVVRAALDAGINYFDTAEVYNDGASEKSLGDALAGRRGEAVIGTKVSTSNARAKDLIAHCEASLKRLGTDYIDLYMLHWPINKTAIRHFSSDADITAHPPTVIEAFEAMQALQRAGKIRAIGLSNHGVRQMREVSATGVTVVANEMPYNLISRAIEKEVIPFCESQDIAIIGYMALQQGVLAGIYPTMDDIPPAQAHSRHFAQARGGAESRHFEQGAEPQIQALLDAMKRIADEAGLTIAALALAWAMDNQAIASTLVGSRDIAQLHENLATSSVTLSPDVVDALNAASQPVWDALGDSPDYYENRRDSRIY